ncbi:hypothetical protein ElyMa_004281900 [Elysia marginata]|uniref:Uncharacterized protein n=1 Tax=Elysia marginata TaxID=1093978 RepID=A0AAV4GWQ1_9GAST|nr:hypothetical protein ElyMa_004281900 [Elysia marginata]
MTITDGARLFPWTGTLAILHVARPAAMPVETSHDQENNIKSPYGPRHVDSESAPADLGMRYRHGRFPDAPCAYSTRHVTGLMHLLPLPDWQQVDSGGSSSGGRLYQMVDEAESQDTEVKRKNTGRREERVEEIRPEERTLMGKFYASLRYLDKEKLMLKMTKKWTKNVTKKVQIIRNFVRDRPTCC